MSLSFEDLIEEFQAALGIDGPKDAEYRDSIVDILDRARATDPVSKVEREKRLFALVNRKFDINSRSIEAFFSFAAEKKIHFNYHQKRRIAASFDRADVSLYWKSFNSIQTAKQLFFAFEPQTRVATVERLHRELISPTLIRKDSKPKDWSDAIKRSLFGGFVFNSYAESDIHEIFDRSTSYESDFWIHLHNSKPQLFSRANTLVFLDCDTGIEPNSLAAAIRDEYRDLSNHGHLAISLRNPTGNEWRTAELAILFAEKFIDTKIHNSFFKPEAIAKTTSKHINGLDLAHAQFDSANIGYHYKDTFVIAEAEQLILLFQKNVADETVIPCPTCRSNNVRSNSYSSLGVKSWECQNPICPDRSKFDRGKRYSFMQLLRQQAIEQPEAAIPRQSVRDWARDVQPFRTTSDVFSMLLRHYTLPRDGITYVGPRRPDPSNRKIIFKERSQYFAKVSNGQPLSEFRTSSALFRRYIVDPKGNASSTPPHSLSIGGIQCELGDCSEVLRRFPSDIFDGAVTSPPYYNAREYSQWPNIYCYLHDMYKASLEVFRTLKPGATYLFNIFNYFDNEKNIVQSAMGDKRMILSAYCVEFFERIGFTIENCIVWDKGEIEGKRAFNQGNFSPYYQAPLNCWEHILVLRKPGSEVALAEPLPRKLQLKPVVKWFGGVNKHGHSAPFPEQIPELLVTRLNSNALILDPFAGSMTTGRSAMKHFRRAVCIEKDVSYFELGVTNLSKAIQEPNLFSAA